ncbi:unnamed protein product [Caenorhabditis brenneri]
MTTTFQLFLCYSIVLLSFENYTAAVNFNCPTQPISGQSGVFPSDVLNLTTFPSNYNCEFKFQIEDGYVYKLTVVANVTAGSGDQIVVTDVLGKQEIITDVRSLIIVPAKSASLKITSGQGTAQFFFKYDYTYVGALQQKVLPTGSPLQLTITALQTYTFISPNNDNVVINTANIENIGFTDWSLQNIFVYDGPDVYSPFVGNLYHYVTSPTLVKSSGNATTLANFYGIETHSYAIANDYKKIYTYDTYTFVAYNSEVTIPRYFRHGISNAYTFYNTMYDSVFLTDIGFGPNGMKADVRPLTPSDESKFYLEYVNGGPYKRSLPQMIPGKLFTMVTMGPELTFTLSHVSSTWLSPYNGRMGKVFSSSLWNPGETSRFNYTFESTELMTFKFNFDSVIIHQAGEQVQCKVGRPGVDPVSVTFSHSVVNPGVRIANGTYLTTSYLGDSPFSSAIISFEMYNADDTLPTTSVPGTTNSLGTTSAFDTTTKIGTTHSVGTTGAYETTTKVGSMDSFVILGVFVAAVLMFL